jgi:hypothetical protein
MSRLDPASAYRIALDAIVRGSLEQEIGGAL